MARKKDPIQVVHDDNAPVVILVEPQLPENVGMTARAMLNCGLTRLRIVRPKMHWPNKVCRYTSAGADQVLEDTQIFETTEEALKDIHYAYALTARSRDMNKAEYTARSAMPEIRTQIASKQRVALIFGGESCGLVNDDVVLCQAVIRIPLNPGFSSLNLSQAVQILSYEWRMSGDETPGKIMRIDKDTEPATKEQVVGFFDQLEHELDESGFLRVKEKRPEMIRNIRNIFQRADLTAQEVRTLRGIITSLVRGWMGRKK